MLNVKNSGLKVHVTKEVKYNTKGIIKETMNVNELIGGIYEGHIKTWYQMKV